MLSLDTTATVREKRELTPVTSLLVIDAPLVALNAAPGQFVVVRVSETGERVPISLTDFGDGTITLVVQRVGKTSAAICALEPGDPVLDVAGPLGAAVELPSDGHAVLIGGGFGAGAIFPIARELHRRGVETTAIVGARTAALLLLDELLAPVCDHLELCTDDGSRGFHGLVTERLEQLGGFTCCYAVGPMPMMRAVARSCAASGLPAQVSLDPVMIDGTGMCGGCRVTVGGVSRFACVDGPFFDAQQIDFDEAAARKAMYAPQERRSCELAGIEA